MEAYEEITKKKQKHCIGPIKLQIFPSLSDHFSNCSGLRDSCTMHCKKITVKYKKVCTYLCVHTTSSKHELFPRKNIQVIKVWLTND